TMNGQAHTKLAAIDATSGVVSGWDPNVSGSVGLGYYGVATLVLDGNRLYIGGDFASISGQARNGLAAVDVTSGAVSTWDPHPAESLSLPPPSGLAVLALSVGGGLVWVGGTFNFIGGRDRMNLAAIDPTTGLANSWDHYCDGDVAALSLRG